MPRALARHWTCDRRPMELRRRPDGGPGPELPMAGVEDVAVGPEVPPDRALRVAHVQVGGARRAGDLRCPAELQPPLPRLGRHGPGDLGVEPLVEASVPEAPGPTSGLHRSVLQDVGPVQHLPAKALEKRPLHERHDEPLAVLGLLDVLDVALVPRGLPIIAHAVIPYGALDIESLEVQRSAHLARYYLLPLACAIPSHKRT
mmetsp:Transcript_54000/g.157640  ORF Transcript_54000/g.157640 Transcript_54000/m.157640 type:complete len:202 (+) Transcript_54000:313-918(+)